MATAVLDMSCQDNAATSAVNDASATNADGQFTVGNSQDYSISAAGGSLARAFDGAAMAVAEAIIAPAPFDFFNRFSGEAGHISFFAKRNNTTGNDTVCGSNSGPPSTLSFLAGTNSLNLQDEIGTSLTLATGVDTTVAHHYALNLKTDDTVLLYVDGALIGSMGTCGDDFYVNFIGFSLAYGEYFNGWFKGIKCYNSTLTLGEIAADALIGGIIAPAGTAPTITSNGGGSTASVSVAENTTAVTTVVATGDATITYSITGGADSGKFSIVGATGVLTFQSAPNYESPTDANTDNVYVVAVTATNDTGTDVQTISVTVTDVAESSGSSPTNARLTLGVGVGL
jgi:hypothetical protein